MSVKKATKVSKETAKKPISIALEDLMLDVIVSFCENAAELGCPRNKEVDMWIREMDAKKAFKVMGKLLDIMDKWYAPKTVNNKEK